MIYDCDLNELCLNSIDEYYNLMISYLSCKRIDDATYMYSRLSRKQKRDFHEHIDEFVQDDEKDFISNFFSDGTSW